MKISIKHALTALRLTMGWYMLFAGMEKLLNPLWTASGVLESAQTFPGFYAWLNTPMNLLWVNPLNAWGMTCIGIALLLGVFVRPAAYFGALLMLLYYFPQVSFPFMVAHGYFVEEHIIYIVVFIVLANSETYLSLSKRLKHTTIGKIRFIQGFI